MQRVRVCLIVLLASVSSPALWAQDTDSLLHDASTELTFEDSLSIFKLIDSLLMLESFNTSQLAARLSYNSNVLWAGRTLGIENFGLAPGLSYYHKSGLYADLSAYWSNDFEPKYYLTITSAGYMRSLSSKFSFIASYDHYFYNLDEKYIPFSNALIVSPFLDLKPFTIRLDYSFYFGDETAHRLMPSLGISLKKKKFLNIDKISFSPSAFMLLGSATITEITFPSTRQEWIAAYIRMRQGLPWYIISSENVFGIMNYSFLLPLTVSHKNWNYSISYSYNIPKALRGETMLLSESGFLSVSVAYFIDLRSKKSFL